MAHHRRPFPTGTKKSFYVRKSFYSRQLYYKILWICIYIYIDMIYQYPKLQTDLIIGPIPEHLPAWSSCYTSQLCLTTKSCRIYRTILDDCFELSYFWPAQPPINSFPGHVLSTIILTPQIMCWFYLTFLRIYGMVNLIFESHTHTRKNQSVAT